VRKPSLAVLFVFWTAVALAEQGVSSPAARHTVIVDARPNPAAAPAVALTADDVRAVIQSAVQQASALGRPAVIAVVDRETNVLAVYRMDGAPRSLHFSGRRDGNAVNDGVHGLDGLTLVPNGSPSGPGIVVADKNIPDPTVLAALSKAGTAAVFETTGNAFTTRTASFIIQEHFPPGIDFTSGGPLFGVQFSNLPCSDVKPLDLNGGNLALPLGLSGDPGGLPLYKNGQPVGAIGIEADGQYTVDFAPEVKASTDEELIALAGTRGFESPAGIRGDQIFVNGIRLPFADANPPTGLVPPSSPLDPFGFVFKPRDGLPTRFVSVTVNGVPAFADPRFFPPRASTAAGGLTAAEVEQLLAQALMQAYKTRAAIRQPLGSFAQVNVTVVDASGAVLGIVRTPDAPIFGFDVSSQKARAAAFFSSPGTAGVLTAAGFSEYVGNGAADGIHLDGAIAFSDRANGFLSRPFFPDGIDGTAQGPFSRPITQWSPFNVGLQIDLLRAGLIGGVEGTNPLSGPCTAIPNIPNGIQIFPGSVPLYLNGVLVGGLGISGDGVDQDDIIAFMGAAGFEAPEAIRSDQFFVRGVRLPFIKFPRHPDL